MVSIEVIGLAKAKAFLKMKAKRLNEAEELALKKAAIHLRGEISASIAGRRAEPASFKTGLLSRTVDFALTKDNAIVFSPLDYSEFIEFSRNIRFGPRLHFNNTKDREQGRILDIFKQVFRSV